MEHGPEFVFSPFRLDCVNECVWHGERQIPLRGKTFAVLRCLLEHQGQLVTKAALFTAVWPETYVNEGALTICIAELRKALGDNTQQPRFIETVHRRGYRFLPAMTAQSVQSTKGKGHSAVPTSPRATSPLKPETLLVGREAELAQLHGWWAKALNGERQIVFVSGEAGSGKTTLVDAFLRGLRRWELGSCALPLQPPNPKFPIPNPGVWVARGQCIEHYGAGEGYMPILEALGRLCREAEGDRVLEFLHHHAPTWLVQMPALLTAADLDAVQRRVAGASRERMLREMAEALETLTAIRPLVLQLEDLHWSDASTLELLAVLARRQEAARLLVLGTYRPVEMLANGHPLRTVRQELHLHRHCQEQRLAGLTEGHVAEYLGHRFGGGAPRGTSLQTLARAIHRRTEGNPLFMVNVVEYLAAQGGLEEATEQVQVGIPRVCFHRDVAPSVPKAGESAPQATNRLGNGDRHSRGRGRTRMEARTQATSVTTALGRVLARNRALGGVNEDIWMQSHPIPSDLRQMIEEQLHRVSAAERRVLEVASVAGVEFSAAMVAAGMETDVEAIEEQCEALVRREHFLRASGAVNWPDGTVAARYGFLHALYQEVLYAQISPSRRIRLHRQIGECEEAGYGQRAKEIATELAVHFERGREYTRAIQYLQQAGENAIQRSAYQEAIALLSKGLELIQTLPDTPLRLQQELSLQLTLGVPLRATKGYGDPEVKQTYTRARELCQHLGEIRQVFPALWGLRYFYFIRAELQTARELGQELLSLARRAQDSALLVQAHFALGATLLVQGEFISARALLEQGVALYDSQQHFSHVSLYSQNPKVACLSLLGHLLWLLGYPDQALKSNQAALTLARELSHPFSLAFALNGEARLRSCRREAQMAQEWAETTIQLSTDQAFSPWLAQGNIRRGWALAEQGQGEEGIILIHQGLATARIIGQELGMPAFLAMLAEACGSMGKPEEGLAALAEALTLVNGTGQCIDEAELYRIKGMLMLQSKGQGSKSKIEEEAERYFLKAIDVARKQQAKSLELRTTVSLARLWQQQGKNAEAHKTLSEVYNWFTEGFDTKDLQEAKALLGELQREL